jgi:hypothetical protein
MASGMRQPLVAEWAPVVCSQPTDSRKAPCRISSAQLYYAVRGAAVGTFDGVACFNGGGVSALEGFHGATGD